MEKRHIARVLIIETLTVALAAIVSGIIPGILFSKLMIMFLYRIINIKARIKFAVFHLALLLIQYFISCECCIFLLSFIT
jgi:hypothetical protein